MRVWIVIRAEVKPDDSMWTLLDGKTVQISMEKLDGMKWWESVMEGDEKINTRKIVPPLLLRIGEVPGGLSATLHELTPGFYSEA